MPLKQYHFTYLCFLCCLFFNQYLFAQNFSIISSAEIRESNAYTYSSYNTLEGAVPISATDYPMQMIRIPIDRPGFIHKIILYLDGRGKGKFTTHIYGHESGLNYPFFAKDLTPPIRKKKRKKGYQAIEIKLSNQNME